MKISPSAKLQLARRKAAFTLIEMIGVLAVIAILAALLIPKVFSAIDSARINGACISCDTVKTAIADHYGKYGRFDAVFGTNSLGLTLGTPMAGYDTKVLLPEGLLDKPFSVKMAGGDPSTNSAIQIVQVATAGTAFGGVPGSAGFFLDGTNDVSTNATFIIQAVLFSVTAQDAKDLNDRIDGPPLGAAINAADKKGRVEYALPTGGVTDVYLYLTSR